MAKLSKIQVIAKHYSRCIIVDIETKRMAFFVELRFYLIQYPKPIPQTNTPNK